MTSTRYWINLIKMGEKNRSMPNMSICTGVKFNFVINHLHNNVIAQLCQRALRVSHSKHGKCQTRHRKWDCLWCDFFKNSICWTYWKAVISVLYQNKIHNKVGDRWAGKDRNGVNSNLSYDPTGLSKLSEWMKIVESK